MPVRDPCAKLYVVHPEAGEGIGSWTIDLLRRYDPDAWEGLYHDVRPTVWRYARSRLATDEQAEDALSEVMVRAMSAIGRYEVGVNGIIPWVVGIARNVVREAYRSGARLRAVEWPVERGAAEVDERLVAQEEAFALRTAFAGLPEPDRELLGLRVVAGLDATTTAQVLGKRPGAIRMAQSRALGRLRVKLREEAG